MTGDQIDVAVHVYWRPGCPSCRWLLRPLRRHRIRMVEINIWEDRQAAARVRSVADGNERVPTVFVGSHAMVNPSILQVLAALDEQNRRPATGETTSPSAAG
jgi:mycoredoxin